MYQIEKLKNIIFIHNYLNRNSRDNNTRSEGINLRFFNEGGEFEYNLMHSYEKFLQYIVYWQTVKKACTKCICFVNAFLIYP